MSVAEICSAGPLTSNIFPSMAPRQMINARPPKVLPTPFSIDNNTADGCMPSSRPVMMATINSDKNGDTFFAVRKTCKAIANNRMSRGIGY